MTRAALLQQLEAALLAGAPLPGRAAQAVLNGIQRGSIDRVIGLSPARSRHERIRAAAKKAFDGMPVDAAAGQFRSQWLAYAASAWLRERHLPECPRRHLDKIQGTFFALLRDRNEVLSVRQLRRILAICDGQPSGSSSRQPQERSP